MKNLGHSNDLCSDLNPRKTIPKRDSTQKKLYDVRREKDYPTRNVINEAQKLTKKRPASRQEVEAMRQRRSSLISKVSVCDNVRRVSELLPSRGGVGAGVLFKDQAFKFYNNSAIRWHAIIPQTLGGNPRPLLYLTSSNHVSKGCEALVSYENGNPGVFRIWDWATLAQSNGSHFVVAIGYDDLRKYLANYGGTAAAPFPSIFISNWTRRTSRNNWINEVSLWNEQSQSYDLVWQYKYQWAPTDENKYFGWGPIIETFPPLDYGDTNELGYGGATLVQDDKYYDLLPSNSELRNDNQGFATVYLDPNITLISRSFKK